MMRSSSEVEFKADIKEIKRAEIDAKIRGFEEAILALKHERNALSPICRLPYDVSMSIFQRIAKDEGQISDISWVKTLTHVCSHWRTTALNSPLLWTRINFRCRDLVLAKLDRSQSALLSVSYLEERQEPENGRGSLLSVLLHLHRIQDLRLAMPANGFESGVLDKLSNPAPALKKCLIQVSQPGSQHERGHWIELSRDVFRSFSNLSSLQIQHCTFDWNGLVNLPRLVSLDIANPGDVRVTSGTLLHILRQLSLLEFLRLVGCLPPPTSSTIPNPVLGLNHLQRLDISDETNRCAHFLHELVIAPNLVLRIHCWDFTSHVDWLVSFVSQFWTVKKTGERPLCSINFRVPRWSENTDFRLELESNFSPQLEPDMSITYSNITPALASIHFHMVLTPIDLQQVSYIQVGIELHESLWAHLAKHVPDVAEMEFMIHDVDSFSSALEYQDDSGTYAFSNLEYMWFYEPCTFSLTSRRRLLKYLRARHRIGRACRKVQLIDDGIPQRYVAKLRKYVAGGVDCPEFGTTLATLSDDMYDEH